MVQSNLKCRKTAFSDLISRGRPALLDGGLATQLEAQGADINNALWSASLLQNDPMAILRAHCAYLDAGAECILTASYQASREGFANAGIANSEADRLLTHSVELARGACSLSGSNAAVAASLGPYGAMLHDGSEYHGDYGVSRDVLRDFHTPRLEIMDGAGVDVLALETVPSLLEAEVLSDVLASFETPSWVSFSCKDDARICDGTAIERVARLFVDHPTVLAIGINCTPPQFAGELIQRLRDTAPRLALIAYPNSGEIYDSSDNSWSGTVSPLDCASAASHWVEAGANMVGGCCRMGPEHIRAIAEVVGGGRTSASG